MNRNDPQESSCRTIAHLKEAIAQLPETLVDDGSCESMGNCLDFIQANELELALDQLEGLGEANSVPCAFWEALARAAREMGLVGRAQSFEDAAL